MNALPSEALVRWLPEACHLLMESSPVPMAELEGASHIVRYANPAFCRLMGKPREVLTGAALETTAGGDSRKCVLDRVLQTGHAETHTEGEHDGQHPPYWSYTVWPIVDRTQHPVGVMMQVTETTQFHRDARAVNEALLLSSLREQQLRTEAESLNEQLRAETGERKALAARLQEANERKDEFLAMLAHELRNPLAPIGNASEILSRKLPHDIGAQGVITIIKRQVAQLTHLIDDLLDVTRITQGRIQLHRRPLDLASVIMQAIETLEPQLQRKQQRLSVTTSTSHEPLYVDGDFTRLVQCIGNIIGNAIKYSEAGGQISVQARAEDSSVVVEIADTGTGISEELLPRVFDLFVQSDRTLDRAQGGLGIGLAVVKRLVEMHEGQVTAHSAGVGQGSTFEIRLPRIPRPSTVRADAISFAAPPRRVLVVDDNKDAATSLAELLNLQGHAAQAVHSGQEALECLASFRPEVALLDIGLPQMNGYELARRLREIETLRGIRLIALTGYGQTEDRQRTQAAGFDAHLVKPVDLQQLERALAGDTDEG